MYLIREEESIEAAPSSSKTTIFNLNSVVVPFLPHQTRNDLGNPEEDMTKKPP